ncbi:MAG: 50S ribosomal protein L16 [Candidatus Liptonbacteria bacterium RIFCSPLOWO2_01_FULL_53_13]|uniref:Large ribosomal subunit protein uL16 n=1 Tax=Candidatus Liptonbacteria bacterium RIFCSPLOWO2_01_FULL_53_13 TaxID=1798651 RepID=A0A1G2CKH6_9BACT|nr:MAG: 50S ribosomal protein L16 [Candidatus Liptonbacteria bacterium RIFCSPLOWO2_01_FULL_53_13]
MLIPKKVKHRKWQKGRSKKRTVETRGLTIAYGSFGLKAMESARIDSRQIESARRTITHFIKREGRLWIRVFPDKPVTLRPPETTMGGGKGSVDHYVFPVRAGRVLFEMDGTSPETARRALRLAAYKLPMKTKVIEKHHDA